MGQLTCEIFQEIPTLFLVHGWKTTGAEGQLHALTCCYIQGS